MLRKPLDCVPQRQKDFLRKADAHSKRLWFVWGEEREGEGEELACGCCGGCQFLDGCIQRLPPQPPSSCAVYVSELFLPPASSSTNTFTKALGLHSLRKALQSAHVKELSCLQRIHRGLLGFYEKRYPPVTGNAAVGRPTSFIGSDSESFVSALASQEASDTDAPASDTGEYYSLENVNEAGLEGHTVPEQLRKRPRKSDAATKQSTPTLLDVMSEDSVISVLPTHCNRFLTLPVRTRRPQSGHRPEHQRQVSDSECLLQPKKKVSHQRMFSAGQVLLEQQQQVGSSTPLHPPPSPFNQHQQSCLVLRIPLVLPLSAGTLPRLSLATTAVPVRPRPTLASEEEPPQSTVSVAVTLEGGLSLTLSPHVEHIITRSVSARSGLSE